MNKDFGKIAYYMGRYYLIESGEHYDVDSSWFAVPIYELENGELETRNAGTDWLFKLRGAFLALDYPAEKYKKVIDSQIKHYNWCIEVATKYHNIVLECQQKIKLLKTLSNL